MRTVSGWALRSGFVTLAVFLAACESPTSPGRTYADVSGNYTGVILGTSQGVSLNATFSLTIAQNGSSLSGTDAIVGSLNQSVPVSGAGTFTGTIESGTNPSVNIVAGGGDCPNTQSRYSGSYDTANHRLTITGPLYITNSDCSIALAYQLTLVLSK